MTATLEDIAAVLQSGGVREKGNGKDSEQRPNYGVEAQMKTIATIYRPDGTEETKELNWPREPGFEMLDKFLAPIIGVESANWEHVYVLWNDKPLDMFVDENGQLNGLQHNAKATEIYRNNAVKRMLKKVEDLPDIVGIAVLFDRRVWY